MKIILTVKEVSDICIRYLRDDNKISEDDDVLFEIKRCEAYVDRAALEVQEFLVLTMADLEVP